MGRTRMYLGGRSNRTHYWVIWGLFQLPLTILNYPESKASRGFGSGIQEGLSWAVYV